MRGIDVSNWQAGLTPSNFDIDFCIVKATEGVGYTDPFCDQFVQNCISNDILWGFYHFARENEPEQEAEYFYNECINYFGHGIPVLDYETSNYNNREWCERFMQKLHDLSGVWAVIYISASRCGEYENSWIPEKCGLWVAGYPWDNPDWTDERMPYNIYPWSFAAIWQFTSGLDLNGYEGRLDGNIAYMDEEAWMKYAKCEGGYEYSKPSTQEKSLDDYALEVVLGKYGEGEARKKMLGDKYEAVQNRVNELYRTAMEVIEGRWGNGWNRQHALEGAGYPYETVQRIVNGILD